MADQPGDPGDNPFKGTPFEAFFSGGGFGGGFGAGGGMPDLSALFAQMQSLMQPYDGPMNFDAALDLARKTVAAAGPDPSPTQRQKDAVADALRLADHWIDGTTAFPSGVVTATAWSRAEWLVETFETWKVLVEPVAASSVATMNTQVPEEMKAIAGPMMGFLGKAVGALLASQTGTGLGTLAGEVLSVSDIGVPLAAPGRAALLPTNIAAYCDGLDVSEDDVLLFLALREAAHQRLFAGVPWLRDHVLGAVTDYARGVEVNLSSIQQRVEEQLRGVDLNDPAALQQLFNDGSLFDASPSPAQQAALERLEVVLALVEGWVDEIVSEATKDRMPAAGKLQEMFRRRRASGGPAEQTFATLVGLELRPRRLRDAATLWGSLRARQGAEARDGVWMSPALLPTAADLDDPLGFREGADAPAEMSDADFDDALRRLLSGDGEGPAGSSGSPDAPGPSDEG